MIQPTAISAVPYAQPISAARPAAATAASGAGASVDSASQASFKEMLLDSIRQANMLRQDADQAVASLGSQHAAGAADVFGAVEQTDLAFRTMIEVHNKLVQAYQEVQHMVD
jgi:flagellar hook-basal body complex protein FliE